MFQNDFELINRMENILITGSSGFLGQAFCKELNSRGRYCTPAVRHINSSSPSNAVEVGDINGSTDYSIILNDIDTVVHIAAIAHKTKGDISGSMIALKQVNTEGSVNLARQAAAAGVRRFIFISSVGVNGINSSQPFTEGDTVSPHDLYSQSKLDAEVDIREIATESAMELVIIRPPLIYGGNAPGNFERLIRLLAKPVPLPFGAVNNKRSMVYVDNLVDFLILCIDHPNAANQTFLISDGENFSLKSLITSIRSVMGKPAWLIPIPAGLLILVGKLIGKSGVMDRLIGDLEIDSSKARTLLGWNPPYGVEEAIAATVLDFYKREF